MVSAQSLIPVAILTGTTASGKTALALELARSKPGQIEIINADSLLVYREMNIGTAKPSAAELQEIPHHLIDIRNPNEPFTAGDFTQATHHAIEEIHKKGKRALIVGGTGFYLKALIYGLWQAPKSSPELRAELDSKSDAELYQELNAQDPESALRIGANDRYRLIRALEIIRQSGKTPTELESIQAAQKPDPRFHLWVTDRESQELEARIAKRAQLMIDQGLIEETQTLVQKYPGARALESVGYAETCRYLQGEEPAGRKLAPGIPGLLSEIILGTRQLVKKQRTWFKGQHPEAKHLKLDSDHDWIQQEFKKLYETT